MTALRRAIDDYLTLRRRLGVTLHEAERVLVAFAAYAERERAEHVTTDLVLRWTTQLTGIATATVNGRCQIIRRFAQWRQLVDPLTEVPPTDLIPGRYRRHPPRLYREEDIPRLLGIANVDVAPPPRLFQRSATRRRVHLTSNEIFQRNPYKIDNRSLFYAPSIGTDPRFADIIVAQVNLFDDVAQPQSLDSKG